MPKTGWKLPLTATRRALLPGASDHAFRKLLYDMFTVGNRMEEIRRRLGARIGLSGPQFTMMMAIAELEGAGGVSVGRVAEYLHVAQAFITVESGKLARAGFVEKKSDAADRRLSLLRISRKGTNALGSLFPLLRQINDVSFDLAPRKRFEVLCAAFEQLVDSSQRALMLLKEDAVVPIRKALVS
jgi:DNA-binding MarR family transcriptional regulator